MADEVEGNVELIVEETDDTVDAVAVEEGEEPSEVPSEVVSEGEILEEVPEQVEPETIPSPPASIQALGPPKVDIWEEEYYVGDKSVMEYLMASPLIVACMLSTIVGTVIGILLRRAEFSSSTMAYISFVPRTIYQQNIYGIIVLPIFLTSIPTALYEMDMRFFRFIAIRVIAINAAITTLGCVIGVVCCTILRPGGSVGAKTEFLEEDTSWIIYAIYDSLRNCFPRNVVAALIRHVTTIVTRTLKVVEAASNTTTAFPTAPSLMKSGESGNVIVETTHEVGFMNFTNLPAICIFALAFGLVLSNRRGSAEMKLTYEMIEVSRQAVMKFGYMITGHNRLVYAWYAPLMLFLLAIVKMLSVRNMADSLKALQKYAFVMCIGNTIYLIILCIVFYAVTRKNVGKFILAQIRSLLMSWMIQNSNLTVVIVMHDMDKGYHVDKRIYACVMPVYTMFCKNAMAMYNVIAVMYIAQSNGVDFDISTIIVMCMASSFITFNRTEAKAGALARGSSFVLAWCGLPIDLFNNATGIIFLIDPLVTMSNSFFCCLTAAMIQEMAKDELILLDERRRKEEFTAPEDFPELLELN